MPKNRSPRTPLQSAPMASDVAARRMKQRSGMLRLAVAMPSQKMLQTGTGQEFAPGTERWAVKTGTDADVGKVDLAAPVVATTVEELQLAQRPPALDTGEAAFYSKRVGPVETTVWQLSCRVTAVKLEADGDYHLVLQGDSGETIIGELPCPQAPFVASTSPFLADITRARAVANAKILKNIPTAKFAAMGKYMVPVGAFSSPVARNARVKLSRRKPRPKSGGSSAGSTFKTAITPVSVTIRGVGFFDRIHGQMGVAPNGIELHPVLDLVVN